MCYRLIFLLCWTSTVYWRTNAITEGGKRAPPGLVPLNPVGIYGSLDVRLRRLKQARCKLCCLTMICLFRLINVPELSRMFLAPKKHLVGRVDQLRLWCAFCAEGTAVHAAGASTGSGHSELCRYPAQLPASLLS